MNGLHYIICSWENTFDAAPNRCVCLENNSASAYSVCVYTETLGVFEEPDSPIHFFHVPSVLTTRSRWLQQFELKRIHFLLIQKVLRSPLTRAWPENRQACGERNQARPGWAGFILEDKTWQRIWRGSSNQMGTDEAHGCVLHAGLSAVRCFDVFERTRATACVLRKLIFQIQTPRFTALILR